MNYVAAAIAGLLVGWLSIFSPAPSDQPQKVDNHAQDKR